MERAGLDDLLRRARQYDAAALGELVEAYSPRVFGLLYRLTGSRDVAEDLLQETFLRVVRAIREYEHSGKFEPWLFRIAANLARDHARRSRRRGVMGSLDASPAGGNPSSTDVPQPEAEPPDGRVVRDEAAAQLNAALDRLPELDREIILLRHYLELPFQDIARMLRVPLGTALARAHRALKRLRKEMDSESS